MPIPQGNRQCIQVDEGHCCGVIRQRTHDIESEKQSSDNPKKVKQWNIDNQPNRGQEIDRPYTRNQEYCCRGFHCGSSIFTRNYQCRNGALPGVRNAESHSDNHDESGGKGHARNHSRPARVGSEFLLEKCAQPGQRRKSARKGLGDGCHSQSPRIVTTADSPIRNKSGVGFSTRTRTGYRDARCTQFRVRCTSGRPVSKRPNTSGSGVTPKPRLSTTPVKR